MADPQEAYRAGYREARSNGLAPSGRPSRAHAWATAVLAHLGFEEPERPDIVSGYRSPMYQKLLQSRWDAGNREGLTSRPACSSQHTIRNAIDVETDVEGFRWYAYILTRFTGARDGRNFGSPGHFDWRDHNPRTPPNICQ